MVELTQEEIQELDQHDIERIWPSDEDVATAASTRINREWNPFLSRSHKLLEQPEPETPTGSDDGGATSESQSAFELLSDGAVITDDITTTAEATSHNSAERSHNEAFEPFQEADLFGANGVETIKPPHRNAPTAAASAPSGAKTEDTLRGERREGMYGGFSMADNLLDTATVDSSLMNSVLDTGGSGGGTREPLWGNTLGFGLLPQAGNTHTLTQSLRGTTTHRLGAEDLPPPIQDPAIMHVMSHPPAAPAMPVVHEEEGGLGSFISHNIQQENPSVPQVAPSDEYDSHYNQGPFVPFHPDSFLGHFDLGNMGVLPERLSNGSSRASTPQQQLQLHMILQRHRDSVDSTTSDMRVAESSSRPESQGSGVVLQGGRRPRCRPTADVLPPVPGRMTGPPAEGSSSSSESESEAEYEDASDVWDTGSSVVSDKQYTEIEPREYHQHQGPPQGGDSQEEEDSEEYSSSDVDAYVGSGSGSAGSGEGCGSSEYDVEDPDSARSTQNTPIGEHPIQTGAGDPGVPLERPAGFSSPAPERADVTTPVNKSGVQVNAVKPTVQPPPANLPPEGGGHWPPNQVDSSYPGGMPQKQPPTTDFTPYFNAYGNPMQYGMQPWMMNMGMPFGMGMPPNMGMMAAAQMMQQQAQQQQQQSLKQQVQQHSAGGDQCAQSSDSQTTCQDTVSSVPPPCMGSMPATVPAPPMGPIPGMQMPPNPMAAMPNMQQMPNPMTSQGMTVMPAVGGDPMAPFGMGNPMGVGVPAPPMPPPPPFMPNFMSMMMMNPQMMPSFGMPGTTPVPPGGMMNPAQMAPGGVPGAQPPVGTTGHTTDINANDTKEQTNNAKIIHDS